MVGGEPSEAQVTFNVKLGSDKKHTFTLPLSTTVADVKAKLSEKDHADVPADRQRLIYSGRILKDGDTLEQVKVKDGTTIHMVKNAASNARQNPAGASSSDQAASAPQIPTNIAAGTGNSPFAQLTGARHAGFHGLPSANMFGADGGMGPPPGLDDLAAQLDNPAFLQQMNEMMNNPQVLEMMLQSPMFRDNPGMRAMLQNPEMRRALFSPESLRAQLQMRRAMEGTGPGGSNFAMPGETDTTAQTGRGSATDGPNGPPQFPTNMFAPFAGGGAAGGGGNPFAALFNPQARGTTPLGSPPTAASTGQGTPTAQTPLGGDGQDQTQTPPNPFAGLFGAQQAGAAGGNNLMQQMMQQMQQNPEMMQNAMQMAGSMLGGQGAGAGSPFGAGGANPFAAAGGANPFAGAGGANPFAGLFGAQEPQDNRAPEDRYESQLRQLNDMGFYDFDRNVQALRRSGGSVQGAIDWLLTNA